MLYAVAPETARWRARVMTRITRVVIATAYAIDGMLGAPHQWRAYNGVAIEYTPLLM